MILRLVETEEEFLKLRYIWDELAETMMPINNFEWMYKWWQHNKSDNELKIIVAEDNDKILGIAPLYINNTKAFKLIPVKKLCLLGGEISDYLDFIIKQNKKREQVFENLLHYILEEINSDEINFSQINNAYKNFDLWEKHSELNQLNFQSYRECWRIDLSKFFSYEEYFNQLSKSHKRSIKARNKKLNTEIGDHEFVFKSDITFDDIDSVAKINIKRQKFLYEEKCKEQRFCYFLDKPKNDFIYDYFVNADSKDKFFACLKCDGKIASYILCMTHKKTLYLWNMAFDPEYEFCAPTKILLNELTKYAFENNYKYIDFMRGNDPYKLKWSNDTTYCYSFFEPKSFKSKIIRFARNLKPDCVTKLFNKQNIKQLLNDAYNESCDS